MEHRETYPSCRECGWDVGLRAIVICARLTDRPISRIKIRDEKQPLHFPKYLLGLRVVIIYPLCWPPEIDRKCKKSGRLGEQLIV